MKKLLKTILIITLLIFGAIQYLHYNQDKNRTKLFDSESPNHRYELKGYIGDKGGATVDFSVAVDLYDKKIGKRIQRKFYYEYHESQLFINWINNNKVEINGHTLDIRDLKKHDYSVYKE